MITYREMFGIDTEAVREAAHALLQELHHTRKALTSSEYEALRDALDLTEAEARWNMGQTWDVA